MTSLSRKVAALRNQAGMVVERVHGPAVEREEYASDLFDMVVGLQTYLESPGQPIEGELRNLLGCHAEEDNKRRKQTEFQVETPHPDPAPAPAPRDVPRPYEALDKVLARAFDQASGGKGKDRHVSREDQPFEDQPICSLQRLYGNGYAFGQAGKKMEEAMRMDRDRAVAELLGAIVYIAAAVIVIEEGEE